LIFKIGKDLAGSKAFSLVDVSIKEKLNTAISIIPNDDGKITCDVTFHKASDYVIDK